MNKLLLLAFYIILLMMVGCSKEYSTVNLGVKNAIYFTTYTIKAGMHYANDDSTTIQLVETNQLKFITRFNESARYATRLATNQADVNKLYGFSDNQSHHHQFSARIGWAWYNNALRLYGYTYNNGLRSIQEITAIPLNTNINCEIQAVAGEYKFVVNDTSITMPRLAATSKALGYKLYPYFGGDETAPHTITILLKEY